MKKVLSVISLMVAFSISAEARRDQRREVRQQGRIAQGVQSGELNRHEAKKLHRGQKRVDHAQRSAAQDGEVSLEERRKINQMQNRQNVRIYQQKHDDQKQ